MGRVTEKIAGLSSVKALTANCYGDIPSTTIWRAQRNIKWIESNLFVPEGKHVGKPLKLTTTQKLIIYDIYGSPTRRYILSIGRKNAKTTLNAALMLLHLVGPEAKPNSSMYSIALTREQAGILFTLACKMVRQSEKIANYVAIKASSKEMAVVEIDVKYKALAAESSSALGLSPAVVFADELGAVRGPVCALAEAMETAVAAQAEPMIIYLSTRGSSPNDFFELMVSEALTGADPTIKCRVYSADANLDPFSEEAIRQANPAYDEGIMNKAEVKRQAEEARNMPSRTPKYLNLILNQVIEAQAPFIPPNIWKENGAGVDDDWGNVKVFAGLDLSTVRDLSALVLVAKINEVWQVKVHAWLPLEGIAEKARLDKTPWDIWANQGYLTLTPGKAIDYGYIAKYLTEIMSRYNIQTIAFDRWGMDKLKLSLKEFGAESLVDTHFTPFGQGYKDMSPALNTAEALLLEGKVAHGNNPVLTMCAANVVIDSDAAGNRKVVKDNKNSGRRIDAFVALIMALQCAHSSEANSKNQPKPRRIITDVSQIAYF